MSPIQRRIDEMNRRVAEAQEAGLYFYLQPLEELDGAWVTAGGDYDPAPVSTATVQDSTVIAWNVTPVVADWAQGALAN